MENKNKRDTKFYIQRFEKVQAILKELRIMFRDKLSSLEDLIYYSFQ